MRTVITLAAKKHRELPQKFQQNDNRFPENLVKLFLENYTKPGDKVIDIFAGLGTALIVAEEMGRIPFGIELDKERFEYIQQQLSNKDNVYNINSKQLDELKLPEMDFAFSSPTYMNSFEDENPLTDFTEKGNYQDYLKFLKAIYVKLKSVMKNDSYIIIEVSNLKNNDIITTLAWDIGKTISEILSFQGEIIVNWESTDKDETEGSYGYGYDHSYCLVFQKQE
ncbi:MAG: DNA methyltransferase [Candidatus Heimdallarchaeota archaeon]